MTGKLREVVHGTGPLEPLVSEPGVTDVLVHGPTEVFVDRGRGLEKTSVRFPDDEAVRRLAQRLASAAGRRLDDASPYVDGRLGDGTRVHAVLAPVSTDGTCLSLRIPARQRYGLDDLIRRGSIPTAASRLLEAMIEARLAFLVTGGAGTGKTTVLGALLGLVPTSERIVVVEDSRELAPVHPHVVHLEARQPNVEGVGEITVRSLVRQALRMRPDRIVVGEVRGPEVLDLLSALNTGHEGGCGTLHANAAGDVPARVEALGVAAGLGRAAVHSQLAAAVDVVVHLVRHSSGARMLADIAGFERTPDGIVVARPALRVRPDGTVLDGPGRRSLEQQLRRGRS